MTLPNEFAPGDLVGDYIRGMVDDLPPPRRRWPRFSLRAVLLTITLLSIVGWYASVSLRQRQAVQRLTTAGVFVYYDFEAHPAPWAESIFASGLGRDFVYNVARVYSHENVAARTILNEVAAFPHLSRLHINAPLTDPEFEEVLGHRGLRSLNVKGPRMTDRALSGVVRLSGLVDLSLTDVKVGAAGAPAIASLPRLERLVLDHATISDVALAEIGRLRQLRSLELHDPQGLSPNAFTALVHLANLRELTLVNVALSEPSIDCIARLPHLELIQFAVVDYPGDHVNLRRIARSLRSCNVSNTSPYEFNRGRPK